MLVWFGGAALAAGEVRVEIVVRERGSGVPVADATVAVDGRAWTPDAEGRVTFDHDPGEVQVEVTAPDHRPATVSLSLGETSVVEELWLYRRSWEQELTVYGQRHDDSVQRQNITIDELRRVPGSFGDPVRALQSLPSVARPSSVEGALVVRGAEANNTGVYVDGVQIPFLFHLLAGKSVLSPSLLSSVDFYPGGMPVRYGDSAQAVVDAHTSDLPMPNGGLHGAAHVDLLEAGLSTRVPLPGELDLTLSGRFSWLSALARSGQLAANAVGSDRPEGLRVPYSDYYARLQRPVGKGRVYATFFGADDAIRLLPERQDEDGDGKVDPLPPLPEGKVDDTDLLQNHFARAVVGWDGKGTVEHHTLVSLGRDRQRNLVQGLGVFASTPQDLDVRTDIAWFTHGNRWQIAEPFALATGFDVRLRSARLQQLGVGAAADEEGPVVRDDQSWLGPYAAVEVDAGPVWVSPGVRWSLHRLDGGNTSSVEPRASARVALTDQVTARGFVGAFSQAPTADRYVFEDVPAALTRGVQASAGVEWRAGAWTASADVYRSTFSDLVVTTEVPVLVPSEHDFSQTIGFDPSFEVTTGEAIGGELLLRRLPVDGWFGWLAVSAGRSVRTLAGEAVPSDSDTPFDATLMVSRSLGRSWGISGKLQAGAGQPYTPRAGVYLTALDAYLPVTGATNSARLPAFFQLDLRVDKTWTARRSRWTVYLDLYNATNHPNPLSVRYTWDFSERVTTAWIPTLPALGAEVTF